MTAATTTSVASPITGSLIRLRLRGLWQSGRFVPTAVAAVGVVVAIFAGGASPAGDGWGLTAYILVPIMAWQVKILLDTEPDTARHLAVVTVGPRRELVAGVAAATAAAYALLLPAVIVPWLMGGIAVRPVGSPDTPPFAEGVLLGLWALILAALPAIGLGALSARVITRNAGVGALALVGGWVVMIVAGLPRSPVRFLAPPLIPLVRAARQTPDAVTILGVTCWMVAWSAAALAVYAALRRRRA